MRVPVGIGEIVKKFVICSFLELKVLQGLYMYSVLVGICEYRFKLYIVKLVYSLT